MPLEPTDWNVVVLGRWNRAILTPSGIANRLFGLEEGTAVEVFVPLDAVGPYQVKHDQIVVVVANDRLIIQPAEPDFSALDRSRALAAKAIQSLPETPLTAVGLNVKYVTRELLTPLQELTSHVSDGRLSDEGFRIIGRSHRRAVEWHEGRVNIQIDSNPDDTFLIHFNFDFPSTDAEEIGNWLSIPIAEVEAFSSTIMERFIRVEIEELIDD